LCILTVCSLYEGRSNTGLEETFNELRDLHSSQNIRVVKLRTMKWAGHVARMDEGRRSYRVMVGKTE
jgi:hypothetical protein